MDGKTANYRIRSRASVFVAKNQVYDGTLVQTIRDGLLAIGIEPVTLNSPLN